MDELAFFFDGEQRAEETPLQADDAWQSVPVRPAIVYSTLPIYYEVYRPRIKYDLAGWIRKVCRPVRAQAPPWSYFHG